MFHKHGLVIVAALVLTVRAWGMAAEPAGNGASGTETSPVGALSAMVDSFLSPHTDATTAERLTRGELVNQSFIALTGEAINPLLGITVLGIYNYCRTAPELRESLPPWDQPVVWVPLLMILGLMLFNSTIGEAVPFLKMPLNAFGDFINKAGAVVVLPLVVMMFANNLARPVAEQLAAVSGMAFPVAYAGEAGAAGAAGLVGTAASGLAWLLSALAGTAMYLAVWMTFNVIDVLILICPFPGLDALLKTFRLGVVGGLTALGQVWPNAGLVFAILIVAVSLVLAGWSFRLSVFGLVYSTDIIFFRRGVLTTDPGVVAFSTSGARNRFGLPLRTLGRLTRTDRGDLAFTYRPLLVLPRKTVDLGAPDGYAAGVGFLNPFLVDSAAPDSPVLRLAPRYRDREMLLEQLFGLSATVACGVGGSLREWLRAQFGRPAAG
ncbi:MAG: hypothetical protein LIQ30_05200 [Planctomycetes bacterium]|nr:hypothetical protein [Planctomycetota bacterium]MCD7897984.1 hypothetical protein [Planctomycetaceae bacterium]